MRVRKPGGLWGRSPSTTQPLPHIPTPPATLQVSLSWRHALCSRPLPSTGRTGEKPLGPSGRWHREGHLQPPERPGAGREVRLALGPGAALAAQGWGRLVMLRRSESALGLLTAAAQAPVLPHQVSVRRVFHSE